MREHKRERYISVCPAPAGMVAVYATDTELIEDTVVAFAVKESWLSHRENHAFDPDGDWDFYSAVVPLISGDCGLDVPMDVDNYMGVYHRADLNDEFRAGILKSWRDIQEARAMRRARESK
jgi:hypothetical protein